MLWNINDHNPISAQGLLGKHSKAFPLIINKLRVLLSPLSLNVAPEIPTITIKQNKDKKL